MIRIRAYHDGDCPAAWRIVAPVFRAGETWPLATDVPESEARVPAGPAAERIRRGGRIATHEAAVHVWRKQGFAIVGTLPKAFRHARLGLVDAYVMYKLP